MGGEGQQREGSSGAVRLCVSLPLWMEMCKSGCGAPVSSVLSCSPTMSVSTDRACTLC